MKNRFKFFGAYFLFWWVFFVLFKALFLLYHTDKTAELTIIEILQVFLHGSRLDLSAVGYLMLIPGLSIVATSFTNGQVLRWILEAYTLLLVLFASFIHIVDMELYKHWGFKLDATPLMYLGSEAAGSGDLWTTIFLLIAWSVLSMGGYFAYRKWIRPLTYALPRGNWKTALTFLMLTTLMFLPIRGSIGVAPMNVGFVYFSKDKPFANHAAVNTFWNLGYALQKMNRLSSYPSHYFDKEATSHWMHTLYHPQGETQKLLNTNRPNVLIILVESFSNKLIAPLGGLPDATPELNRLSKEGILFSNFYSSGDRTDKGIVSVLNGYPAQPVTSIIKFPSKSAKLPYLSHVFANKGYHTRFTYGYDINYANFKSFLLQARFDHLTDKTEFTDRRHPSKWGVHDHYVLEKLLDQLDHMQQPFFTVSMTLSSHEPFDVPMEPVYEGKDDETLFLNSVRYTDKSLGDFLEAAKTKPWWNETLVILVADHGSRHPRNNPIHHPDRFRIPMLWLGGALSVKDTVVSTYGTHTDIANTLLGQLGAHHPEFTFSRDMLRPTPREFGWYVFNNGYGLESPQGTYIYDLSGKISIREEGPASDTLATMGKALMQALFSDFNAK